ARIWHWLALRDQAQCRLHQCHRNNKKSSTSIGKAGSGSKLPTSGSFLMRVLTVLLLVIPTTLQICTILLLLRRKLHKRFAWFFVYVCYALFEAGIRLTVSHSRDAYFIVYWSTAIPGAVLTLLALWESFLAIFWPETRLRWFMWVFWSC